MSRRPRDRSVRFNMRLSPYQAERFIEIQKRLGVATASDAFDYLVTLGSHKDCGFEELVFAMGDQMSETVERRFRHIAFMLELSLAMTDTHVKFRLPCFHIFPKSWSRPRGKRGRGISEDDALHRQRIPETQAVGSLSRDVGGIRVPV